MDLDDEKVEEWLRTEEIKLRSDEWKRYEWNLYLAAIKNPNQQERLAGVRRWQKFLEFLQT